MKFRYLAILFALVALSCANERCRPQAATVPAPAHSVFTEGLIADITPKGWLEETLRRQREGLTGHPEAMDYPYNSPLWAGEIKRDSEGRGADWWRFEQTAYYLDGLTRLAYITDDSQLLAVWQENLEHVLANPLPFKPGQAPSEEELAAMQDFVAQITADPNVDDHRKFKARRQSKMLEIKASDRPEGRLGPETESMAWPFAVFFRALKACYEATGDERIPAALEKNYLSYTHSELSMSRFLVNIEGMLWTWSLTGNDELLARAEEAWNDAFAELDPKNCADDSPLRMHGVTMNELLKVPVILYEYTGKTEYLDQALNASRKMEGPNMLIDGVNSSSEHLAGNDPLASHETCDISDYSWTAGYFLLATGGSEWADKIERCMFNAAFGCITKDFKSMQYFSCPNQFICTGNSDHNAFKYGKTWMQYRPIHETECCIGNLHRYFPNYVSRMWLKDRNGSPVAALYGPSEVLYDLGDGVSVRIEELGEYPFVEKIDFRFTFFRNGRVTREPLSMDFTFRVPLWCGEARCSGDGAEEVGELQQGFNTVSRQWKSGDIFSLELPMTPVFEDNAVAGRSLCYGPLVFSYSIPADCVVDTLTYDNLAGKKSGNPDFVSWSMTPAGKWNYALSCSSLEDVEVVRRDVSGYPFDPGCSPVVLKVKAAEVDGWELKENRFTPALPAEVKTVEGSDTVLELVPYGSTTLRLTIFPVQD
ncbi:MAG: glycoside hydrolase family 127 protein [Candidatus Cryptobacteroides sp.]|nr:glycoside hydrolase family 127 protein [Candidatus Cryptobacteroides sp.]